VNNALSLAILAGGHSQRFGEDKALVLLQGRPLLAHILERTEGLAAETFIVTNRAEAHARFGQRMVGDLLPGTGLLGGLYTALYHAAQPWLLALACDMPLVNRALLEFMLTLRGETEAVVPSLGGLPEPLHTLWSKACLEPMRTALERGDRRVVSLFPVVKVRTVSQAEIEAFDPDHLSFVNVNTPAQLAEVARRLAGQDRQQGDIPDELRP
jgi:molybdopterin-guanine dinucleotide biosynthesis protein A